MDSDILFSLYLLAKQNALNEKIEMSSKNFAELISASQQTASRRIIKLEKEGLINRDMRGTSQFIIITKKGQKILEEVYLDLKEIFEKLPKVIEIEGKLFEGLGEGGYYVTKEGYKKQFLENLKFNDIYAGTLNLELVSEDAIKNWKYVRDFNELKIKIKGFKNKDRTYGDVYCYKCMIENQYRGAVLDIVRTSHIKETKIEIISPVYLRGKLKLKNGDIVKIKILLNSPQE